MSPYSVATRRHNGNRRWPPHRKSPSPPTLSQAPQGRTRVRIPWSHQPRAYKRLEVRRHEHLASPRLATAFRPAPDFLVDLAVEGLPAYHVAFSHPLVHVGPEGAGFPPGPMRW